VTVTFCVLAREIESTKQNPRTRRKPTQWT